MKRAMPASLQRRFADIEETDFLTILDPRFKDKSFSTATFCQDALNHNTVLKSKIVKLKSQLLNEQQWKIEQLKVGVCGVVLMKF